jgi:heme exporter protein D
MNWNSAAEFFDMGGHGLFVWGSYGVCLLVMILEPLLAARRRRQALHAAVAQRGSGTLRDEEDE